MTKLDNLLDPGEFLVGGLFNRILKSAGRFIIAGYASPILVDKDGRIRGDREGDSISLEALDKGYDVMMSRVSRRKLMVYHSSTQIGELIPYYVDEDGVRWDGGVVYNPDGQYEKQGLFVIAEVFDDRAESKRYKAQMEMGNMLAFSIGGETIHRSVICEGGFCRNEIDELELSEVSSCQIGMNPEAKAFILKSIKPKKPNKLSSVESGASLLKMLLTR